MTDPLLPPPEWRQHKYHWIRLRGGKPVVMDFVFNAKDHDRSEWGGETRPSMTTAAAMAAMGWSYMGRCFMQERHAKEAAAE